MMNSHLQRKVHSKTCEHRRLTISFSTEPRKNLLPEIVSLILELNEFLEMQTQASQERCVKCLWKIASEIDRFCSILIILIHSGRPRKFSSRFH